MKRFPIKFSGPISSDTQELLDEFIDILTKYCQIARAQARKFKDIDWRAGIIIDSLPGLFKLEQGTGSCQHQANLYFRDVMIARNVGLNQTEIYLEQLKNVIQQHEKRRTIDFTVKRAIIQPEKVTKNIVRSSYAAALIVLSDKPVIMNFPTYDFTENKADDNNESVGPGDYEIICVENEYDDCDVSLAR
jgi:hypothetical protein